MEKLLRVIMLSLAVVIFLHPVLCQTQPARMVEDLSTESHPVSLSPYEYCCINGVVFFAGSSEIYGSELYKMEYPYESASLVQDIYPGIGNATPEFLTAVNDVLFFRASDGQNGCMLWKCEPPYESATYFPELMYFDTGSYPDHFLVIDETLFFVCMGALSESGSELWKCEYPFASVEDIPYCINISELTNVNGTLIFSAESSPYGVELWKSEFPFTSAVMIQDISSNSGSFPSDFCNANGTLIFSAIPGYMMQSKLFKCAPPHTSATQITGDYYNPQEMTNFNGVVLLKASRSGIGAELWKLSPPYQSLTLVQDLHPGLGGSNPFGLTNADGICLFSANDNVHGNEFFKTVPPFNSIELVQDMESGSAGYGIHPLYVLGDVFFFTAETSVYGAELWASNAPFTTAYLVEDIYSGVDDSYPSYASACGEALFFSALTGTGFYEMFKCNPPYSSVSAFQWLDQKSSQPNTLIDADGALVFHAYNGSTGAEFYQCSTPFDSISLLQDMNPGSGNSILQGMHMYNETLFIWADSGGSGKGVWKSEHPYSTSILIQEFQKGESDQAGSAELMDVDGTLFFVGSTAANGLEVWKSVPPYTSAEILADVASGSDSSYPEELTQVGGNLFFVAWTSALGTRLYISEPPFVSTAAVASSSLVDPTDLTEVNDVLFLTDLNADWEYDLFKCESPYASVELIDLDPASSRGSFPWELTDVDGALIFSGFSPDLGVELWKVEAPYSTAELIEDINPGAGLSYPTSLTNIEGTLYFRADDGIHGYEPWICAPPYTHAAMIKDVTEGNWTSGSGGFARWNSEVYFAAWSLSAGMELWKTNGSDSGTSLLMDIDPGIGSSEPRQFILSGGRLFFIAGQESTGNELWVLNLPSDLSLTKTVSNAQPSIGDMIDFTVTIRNDGEYSATNIVVSDILPVGLSYQSCSPSQGAYYDAAGEWNVGALDIDASATLVMTVQVLSDGTMINVAEVSQADQYDPDSTPNNQNEGEDDIAYAWVAPDPADLSLTMICDNYFPLVGDDVQFTLTTSNAGPFDVTGVQVLDLLPPELFYLGSSASQGTYSPISGIWDLGDLGAGNSASLTITVRLLAYGSISNAAEVYRSDRSDPDSIPDNHDSDEDDISTITFDSPAPPVPALDVFGMCILLATATWILKRNRG